MIELKIPLWLQAAELSVKSANIQTDERICVSESQIKPFMNVEKNNSSFFCILSLRRQVNPKSFG